MSQTLQITKNIDRAFYSVYRPILVQVKDLDSTAAFLTATIERKTAFNSNNYQTTGITFNAYQDNDQADHFTFNLMGYAREIIESGGWTNWHQYVRPGREEHGTRLRIRIHANRYSSTPDSPLEVDISDIVVSEGFFGLHTATRMTQRFSMNFPQPHTSIDRLILGDNKLGASEDISLRLNQNSPQYLSPDIGLRQAFLSHKASNAYTINRSDTRSDAIYIPAALSKAGWGELKLGVIYLDGENANLLDFDLIDMGVETKMYKIPVHPEKFGQWVVNFGGDATKTLNIIDANGNLTGNGLYLQPFVVSAPGLFVPPKQKHYHIPEGFPGDKTVDAYFVNYSDKPNNGVSCDIKGGGKGNRTKFVFQTASGSWDWLNIYGREEKTTTFDSVIYDKFASLEYNISTTSHTRSVLHNTREDIIKIVSQPVPREIALHMEDLITSTSVFVDFDYGIDSGYPWGGNNNMLLPILIRPGSFKIYNTEDSMSFVEFEYILSEEVTMQKG